LSKFKKNKIFKNKTINFKREGFYTNYYTGKLKKIFKNKEKKLKEIGIKLLNNNFEDLSIDDKSNIEIKRILFDVEEQFKLSKCKFISKPIGYSIFLNQKNKIKFALLTKNIKGVPLTKYVSNRLDFNKKVSLIEKILTTLKKIHDSSVAHGDFNSKNVEKKNYLKIVNFGLPKYIEIEKDIEKTASSFSPPELFEKNFIDKKSDIFTLGLVLKK
jgi:serine/threonine protein kinase